MKNILMAILVFAWSAAAAQATEKPWKGIFGAGATGGGEDIAMVQFADGSTKSIESGSLYILYVGVERPLTESISLQATIGYHADVVNASNQNMRFTRIPVDLIAYYSLFRSFRLGGGIEFIRNPKFSASGTFLNEDTKFKPTTGLLIEAELFFSESRSFSMKLRSLRAKFKSDDLNGSIDGNSIGLLFSAYF